MNEMKQFFRRLHQDEDGLESLQVVIILGIAAVILLLIIVLFPQVRQWVMGSIQRILSFREQGG